MTRHYILRTLIPILVLSFLFSIPGMPAQAGKAASAGTAFHSLHGWNFLPEAPPNNKPVITESSPQPVTMSEDGAPTSFSLTLHATDTDGDMLTWSIETPATNGTASASGIGGVVDVGYTPNADYYGSDSFMVQVSDGKFKDSLTVNVTIEPVNDAPVITGHNPLSTPQNTPLTIILADLLVTDVDNAYPNGFSLTVLSGANYSLDGSTITPIPEYMGILTVPVKVNDGAADSNTFDLDVEVAKPSRTYYVDKNNVLCSDGGQGTLEAPFCTIGKGAALAAAGDTVYVLQGDYAETVVPANSGAAGRPITLKADPGVTVTGDPTLDTGSSAFSVSSKSYITIDGFDIYHTIGKGIYVDASDHVIISNNYVSYAGAETSATTHQQGINLRGTINSTVTGNVTDHNSCIGIRLINNSNNNTISNNVSFANASVIAYSVVEVSDAAGIELTGSSYNTVINNITYGNEDTGINLYVDSSGVGSSYNLVIGNLSYGNGDHGIDNNNSPNNTIVGNTVHGNGTTGINFEGTTGSHNATVANNIISANGFTPPDGSFGGNLRVDAQSVNGTALDYNLFNKESASVQIIWNGTNYASLTDFHAAEASQEGHGVEADPLFAGPVDPILRVEGEIVPGNGITGNYHLRVGSPAIDSANSNAPSQPLTDIEGKPRVDDPVTENTGTGVRTYDDRGAYEFQLKIITLNYSPGPNGSLSGETFQEVSYGGDGTAVSALPDSGYQFVDWSDGSTDNPRTDTNVTEDLDVTANFIEIQVPTCVNVAVVMGWNMISVPVIAEDMNLGALFRDISQTAYAYNGSYRSVAANESLDVGVGYWMYFNGAHTYTICGEPSSTRDIPVSAGWNMIGPFEESVAVDSISSIPDGILSPIVYGYNSVYFEPTDLQPGSGYWAYVSKAGTLHMGATQAGGSIVDNQAGSCSLNWLASIKVRDSSGKEQLLWIGQGPSASDGLNDGCGEEQLPPTPPDGAFDARLVLPGGQEASHQDYRSSLNGQVEWLLEFQPGLSSFPFTFVWDPAALPEGIWRLQDLSGGTLVNLDMTIQAAYTLEDPEVDGLSIRYETLKAGFQLYLPMVKP